MAVLEEWTSEPHAQPDTSSSESELLGPGNYNNSKVIIVMMTMLIVMIIMVAVVTL